MNIVNIILIRVTITVIGIKFVCFPCECLEFYSSPALGEITREGKGRRKGEGGGVEKGRGERRCREGKGRGWRERRKQGRGRGVGGATDRPRNGARFHHALAGRSSASSKEGFVPSRKEEEGKWKVTEKRKHN